MSTAQIAIVDGHIVPAGEARLPITDEGLVRGDAIFEVIRVYDGTPFALDEHLDRMTRSGENLRLDFDRDALAADTRSLVQAAPHMNCMVRLIVTRAGHRIGIVEDRRIIEEPVTLKTITYQPTLLLEQIKSVSYAANMMATRLAQEQGADEALLVSPDDVVLEGPTFSLFFRIDDGPFVTPPLTDHVLDSITRRLLLAANLGATEQRVTRADLDRATEAIAVSTAREVQPVSVIDGRELPVIGGEQTVAMQQAFRRRVDGELTAG
jgi:branched-subunit amino acid aminotransferase/4-amino-4-deoxychorismate lyase